MKYLLEIGLFIIVLFLYLHIYYHLKVSNDLEVYSIQQPSKDKLEEVCNLRQPLYFDMTNDDILQTCNLSYIDENYNPFDIKIRDVKSKDNDNLHLPISLKEGIELFKKDEESKYINHWNLHLKKTIFYSYPHIGGSVYSIKKYQVCAVFIIGHT